MFLVIFVSVSCVFGFLWLSVCVSASRVSVSWVLCFCSLWFLFIVFYVYYVSASCVSVSCAFCFLCVLLLVFNMG